MTAKAVVLVEGLSDQAALEALAKRQGRDLDAEGVALVSIGGAQAIGRFLDRFGPKGLDLRLAGLYDAGEERDFRRGLERAGLGADLDRAELERLGFYVCVADLEEELIRALGVTSVEGVVEAQGTSAPSGACRGSLRGAGGTPRSSFVASSAAAAAARSATRGCLSRRWIWPRYRGRSKRSFPMFQAQRLEASLGRSGR